MYLYVVAPVCRKKSLEKIRFFTSEAKIETGDSLKKVMKHLSLPKYSMGLEYLPTFPLEHGQFSSNAGK